MECHNKENGSEYLDNLIALFKLITSNHNVIAHCYEAYEVSQQILNNQLKHYKKHNSKKWELSISPNIEIELKNKKMCGIKGKTTILLGGSIAVEDDILIDQSLVVSILFTADNDIEEADLITHACYHVRPGIPEIIRRFHFDLDTKLKNNDRPLSHLQYGGKFSTDYIKNGSDVQYNLFKALDHPRIPIPPYDLILIFDMIFDQFEPSDLSSIKIENRERWHNLVKTSENLWIVDYFIELANEAGKANREYSLYQHMCTKH